MEKKEKIIIGIIVIIVIAILVGTISSIQRKLKEERLKEVTLYI